jgi:hypothetical protein|tara:strand:- start:2594 stop:2977 length:384 start_codon:yes stop_codon:yes gene_type:complete
MVLIEIVVKIILFFFAIFFILKFLKYLLTEKKRIPPKQKKIFLTNRTKSKADKKFNKLLRQFKKRHKRKPSKDELFRIVITASHHTFPVKGRNVRRWTKGKRGHWNRQKVRKYLLEKHKIVKTFRMR